MINLVQSLFPDEAAIKMAAHIFETCRLCLLSGKRPPHIMLLYLYSKGGAGFGELELPNENIPDAAMRDIAVSLIGNTNSVPIAAVHVFDGWYLARNPGEPPSSVLPSQSPDRQECINVILQTLDHRSVSGFLPYEAAEGGVLTIISDDVEAPAVVVASVMAPLWSGAETCRETGNPSVYDRLLSAFMQGAESTARGYFPEWNKE